MASKKGKGANQYGRYLWIPEVKEGSSFSVSLWGKGYRVSLSGGDGDAVMTEIKQRVKEAKELVDKDATED